MCKIYRSSCFALPSRPVVDGKQHLNRNANGKVPPAEAQLTDEQIIANMTPAEKQKYAQMSPADQAAYINTLKWNDGSRGASGNV